MDQREYWEEIKSIAEYFSDNRPAALGGLGWAADYSEYASREEMSNVLHEKIDGHSWVIYTGSARSAIAHSRNPNYMMEEFGSDCSLTNFDNARCFWAMTADVNEQIELDKYDLEDLKLSKDRQRLAAFLDENHSRNRRLHLSS